MTKTNAMTSGTTSGTEALHAAVLPVRCRSTDAGTLQVIASTPAEDRYGDVLPAEGWVLDNYRENPVVLIDHRNSAEAVVGRAVDVALDRATGALMVEIEFADTQRAREIRKLYEDGFARGVSVGFRPLKPPQPLGEGRGYLWPKNELVEISLVAVPANPEAVSVRKLSMREEEDETMSKANAEGVERLEALETKMADLGERLTAALDGVEELRQKLQGKAVEKPARSPMRESVRKLLEYLERRAARHPDAEALVRKVEQEVSEGFDELTLGRLALAMARGPADELERRALSEGSIAGGGVLVPTITSLQFIDALRARQVTVQAGATVIPLESQQVKVPKLASDPTAYWHTENDDLSESDPTFSSVDFEAKTLVVGPVRASVELVEDGLNLEQRINDSMSRAAAVRLDYAALYGSGTAPEPKGVSNFSNLAGTVAAGGALADYSKILEAIQKVEEANADPVTAAIMAPRTAKDLAALEDSTGQPLRRPPKIQDLPFLVTTSVPTNLGTGTDESEILLGNWPLLWIGVRTQLQLVMIRERFMTEKLQVGFLAYLRTDIQAAHEAAFAKITGIQAA